MQKSSNQKLAAVADAPKAQSPLKRRTATVPAVAFIALVSTLILPFLLIVGTIADTARRYWRLPTARLACFVVIWSWLELAGVARATSLWLRGRSDDQAAHYSLQSWWVEHLMNAVQTVFGLDIEVSGADAAAGGPIVVLSRHASLADSLLTIWCLTSNHGLHPRVVLKRELLADPCLDIVGGRLPNYFVDRGAADSTPELNSIRGLSVGMGERDAAIIFPEGTRANPEKRKRALDRLEESHPERAQRLAALGHLLPPRPKGSFNLIDGCPTADVVLAVHTGFEGMDTFGGIIAVLGKRRVRISVDLTRIPREQVPKEQSEFGDWLDQRWLELDEQVDHQLMATA